MTGRSILQGDRVRLRPPEPHDQAAFLHHGDPAAYRAWVNPTAPKTATLSQQEVDHWYLDLCSRHHAWVLEVGGRAIGSATLTPSLAITERAAVYTIAIFDPTRWGHGYGTAATRLVLAYAFGRLRLHVVGLYTRATNRRAIACYTKCGFVPVWMERDGGRTYLVMACFTPRRARPNLPPPQLIICDLGTLRRTGQLTLRPLERAYLGIAPGDPVTTDVADGVVIVRRAQPTPEGPRR